MKQGKLYVVMSSTYGIDDGCRLLATGLIGIYDDENLAVQAVTDEMDECEVPIEARDGFYMYHDDYEFSVDESCKYVHPFKDEGGKYVIQIRMIETELNKTL